MLYYPMPLPILAVLVIAFVCYMYRHRNKQGSNVSFPKRVPEVDTSKIKSVIEEHSDCTAEVFDVCSYTLETNPVTMRHIPGDPVTLKIVDDTVAVFVDNVFISKIYPKEGSFVKEIVETGRKFYAYIGGRDMAASNPNWMDFLSVIVFYKIDGVPPTKVNLNF